jgi:hypothetical protein
MEACFVFLDEAHTRGIDLKLPSNYRAAVTLGPGSSSIQDADVVFVIYKYHRLDWSFFWEQF